MNTTAASTIAPPLDPAQTLKVHGALDGLTPTQLQWVSGYVAGLAAQHDTTQSAISRTAADSANTLTILYGSQTANGRGIAEELMQSASNRGISANLFSLADYKPANVATVQWLHAVKLVARHDKQYPFEAEVLSNQKITGAESSKDVRHIELSLEGSGVTYEPGDSLGVIAENPPRLIDDLLETLGFSGDEIVQVNDSTLSIRDACRTELEVTASSLLFLRAYADLAESEKLADLLQPAGKDLHDAA